MASRISHRAWRNSFSRSRFTVTRSSGTAIIVSTDRMMVAMTNSRRVKPRSSLPPWRRSNFDSFIIVASCAIPGLEAAVLLNRHGGLRAVHGDGLQIGIARSAPGDGQGGLTGCLRLESYRDHRSLPGDSTGSRRPRGRNL